MVDDSDENARWRALLGKEKPLRANSASLSMRSSRVDGERVRGGHMKTRDFPVEDARLIRLMNWMSPSFPIGAYSYSHGIEYAVEAGLVHNRAALRDWISEIIATGTGRVDADLHRAAHESVRDRDETLFVWALERGDAMRTTRELGEETERQGQAFLAAIAQPWPADGLDWARERASRQQRPMVYPVAVGAVTAAQGIPLKPALTAYLHALAANLVSAGIRLIPLGQSDGQRTMADLEPVILRAAEDAMRRNREDIGQATLMVDWASARHETQYTRLFRS